MSNYSQNKNIPSLFFDPNIVCLKCRYHSKEPPQGERVNYYSCASLEITNWVGDGNNVGATSLTGYAVFIDGDAEETRAVIENWIDTLWWNTGNPRHRQYAFFLKDEPLEGAIPLTDGGYIKTKKGYVIIPPSIHPNGRRYGEEINDVPIALVRKSDLLKTLQPYMVKKKRKFDEQKSQKYGKIDTSILEVLKAYNVNIMAFRHTGAWIRGSHPIHGSETGTNFAVNPEKNAWHCFRHDTGGGAVSLIAVLQSIVRCEEVGE